MDKIKSAKVFDYENLSDDSEKTFIIEMNYRKVLRELIELYRASSIEGEYYKLGGVKKENELRDKIATLESQLSTNEQCDKEVVFECTCHIHSKKDEVKKSDNSFILWHQVITQCKDFIVDAGFGGKQDLTVGNVVISKLQEKFTIAQKEHKKVEISEVKENWKEEINKRSND